MKKCFPRAGKFALTFFFCLIVVLSLNATAFAQEVRVPVLVSLEYPVAGVQFKFSHTDGLEFVSYEKSEDMKSAMTTPAVSKNGHTYVGVFSSENDFSPQDGKLNAGYLVFNHSGEPSQSVTMAEVKLVEIVDKDTTKSETLTIIEEIEVPLSEVPEFEIGFEDQSPQVWMFVAGTALALLCTACFVIVKQRSMLKKKHMETPNYRFEEG